MKALIKTDFIIPETLKKYSGKVRDILYLKNKSKL